MVGTYIYSIFNYFTTLIFIDFVREEEYDKKMRSYARFKRYLGLNRQYKVGIFENQISFSKMQSFQINRRYEECVAPGDLPGHCKHAPFCAMDVIGSSRGSLDYLCVITKV